MRQTMHYALHSQAMELPTSHAEAGAPARRAGLSALLSYGFRPFFLLGGAWAPIALVAFTAALAGAVPVPVDGLVLGRWHGHEMLFGFVAAAVAGFLLTAVPTWTSSEPVRGLPLGLLCVLWLAGRVVLWPWLGLQSTPWIMLDAAFFPALAAAVGIALVRARNYRNFQFILLLLLLGAADFVFLAVHLAWIGPTPFDPLRFAANLVLLMIAVVGGRIVPLFTRNALLRARVKVTIAPRPWLERASLAAVAAVIVIDLTRPDTPAGGAAAAVAALLLGARVAGWHGHRTLGMPIVWILHAGYLWLAIALALKSAWLLGGVPWAANWLHALTAGAFGTMILGVATRVALGHAGRDLVAANAIVVAYGLVIIGAVLRIAMPALMPGLYLGGLAAAAAAWAGAFVIFVLVYAPILLAPRRG